MVGFGCVQRSCEGGTTLSLPPPLRGRVGEGGSPKHGLSSWLPPSLPSRASFARLGPRKGGGNERAVPASHENLGPKFSNDSNPVLLCMGLFSPFLIGRPS
ncbi:hypothetical protein ABIE89_001152 [Bradyrhizobium niftali]